MGNAVILLSNWELFGIEERSLYHFDLSDALQDDAPPDPELNQGDTVLETETTTNESIPRHRTCGFRALLECIPKEVRLRSDQKRKFKADVKALNTQAQKIRSQNDTICYQPMRMPLKISPASTVVFAYETTRIAFVLDASPTLTSTFGFAPCSTGDVALCPLDRLAGMAKTFFHSLIQPVQAALVENKGIWRPTLAVSVLAVFPRSSPQATPETQLLVRDFRVVDEVSAGLLTSKIKQWALTAVENEIAKKLSYRPNHVDILSGHDAGLMPAYTSYLKDLMDAGDAALSTLSSAARPLLVVATDGRAVSCDAVVGVVSDAERVDVPLIVLDLSGQKAHAASQPWNEERNIEQTHLMSYDPLGGAFPIYMSDDADVLYGICKATGGCFFDKTLIDEAATAKAGCVESESILFVDHFFSYKRHSIHPNAVQWYTLFSLSPLSPLLHSQLGRLPAPTYIRQKAFRTDDPVNVKLEQEVVSAAPSSTVLKVLPNAQTSSRGVDSNLTTEKRKQLSTRSIFATYFVNPVRPKSLLMMRIKEGYRAKQYGLSTVDPDKVSIQFTLPLDFGTVIHYELSYRAMPGHQNMVGFAHIKIELAGEHTFIQTVKGDFLSQGDRIRPTKTMAQQVSRLLCRLLHSIRKEDMLMSYLSPIKWGDQLLSPDTPFVRRLGSLSVLQRKKHFRSDEFDIVVMREGTSFGEVKGPNEEGERALLHSLSTWATQSINDGHRFVKRIESSSSGLPMYCQVDLEKRRGQLFSVLISTFAGTDAKIRLMLIESLKRCMAESDVVKVLPNQVSRFLVGDQAPMDRSQRLLESLNFKTSWDLLKDEELMPLLIKRRMGIGNFLLLEANDNYCLLAKLVPGAEAGKDNDFDEPGDLVQYELSVKAGKEVVDLHMEGEGGKFFLRSRSMARTELSRFERMASNLRTKDQECSRALHCRTRLLQLFEGAGVEDLRTCVHRLLAYAFRYSTQLCCFDPDQCGPSNEILQELTQRTLLDNTEGALVVALGLEESMECAPVGFEVSIEVSKGDSWFVVKYKDTKTISIVHLSSLIEVNTDSKSAKASRRLTYFTIGIGDLYSKRDDLSADINDSYQLSERDCVKTFASVVDASHVRNYSSAAYLALLRDDELHFDSDEIMRILMPIQFVEVCSVVTTTGPKLRELIETMLRYIDNGLYFFFDKTSNDDKRFPSRCNDESESSSLYSSRDGDNENESGSVDDLPVESVDGLSQQAEDIVISEVSPRSPPAPVFARVSGLEDDSLNSKTVSIFLSVFQSDMFPDSHRNAARQLFELLNSFVAEQTLERLRQQGKSINDADLRIVKSCMKQARNVVSIAINTMFYVGAVDGMVSASNPTGCDKEIDEGLLSLLYLIGQNDSMQLVPFVGGGYVSMVKETFSEALAHFCFIRVTKSNQVLIQVYHPLGSTHASEVVKNMHDSVSELCHRVNQIQLLRNLHRSRVASKLLISPSIADDIVSLTSNTFPSGVFECPVVFGHSFELFYRCSTNLVNVVRTIEATVLHPFTINNQRNYFVYKDESDSIFYMRLEPGNQQIKLTVQGINKPGPSVTSQLTGLIQKRLLQISVDSISALLVKNSSYVWKQVDLDFIKFFEVEWKKVDPGLEFEASKQRYYRLPNYIDPGFLLLFFRQNLCGSTFFHLLSATDSHVMKIRVGDTVVCVPAQFYYNNAPTTLDPMFQPSSTLTTKGAEYARAAGTGVAIIDVKFHDRQGAPMYEFDLEEQSFSRECDNTDSWVLRSVESGSELDCEEMHLSVTVTSTALRGEFIHDWIKLTLQQVLLCYTIERHLKRTRIGWCPSLISALKPNELPSDKEQSRQLALESACRGLPALLGLFEVEFPHPAVSKALHQGMTRSSSVSTVALEALECLVGQLGNECSRSDVATHITSNVNIIRLSRDELPQQCRLIWDKGIHRAVVDIVSNDGCTHQIVDKSVDCPEYIFVYVTPECTDEDVTWASPLKLFEEVSVGGGPDTSDNLRESIRGSRSRAFRRSFAFVLSVKRNQRVLYAYNWKQNVFRNTVSGLANREQDFCSSFEVSVDALQRSCLGSLAPKSSASIASILQPTETIMTAAQSANTAASVTGELSLSDIKAETMERSGRRAIRPVSIRRPKLVGKSVEGAAAHAVAASRQRASSNIFRGSATGGTLPPKKEDETAKRSSASTSTPIPERTQPAPLMSSPSFDDGGALRMQSQYKSYIPVGTRADELRIHGAQTIARSRILKELWWSKKTGSRNASMAVSSFTFSHIGLPLSSIEVTELIGLPKTWLTPDRLHLFGRTLCHWIPVLHLTPIQEASPLETQSTTLFLVGEMKATRNFKCQVLIKLSAVDCCVRASSKIVLIPRDHAQTKFNSRRLYEKDSAALHKLAVDLKIHFSLERLMFDYLSSVAEHAMKSFEAGLGYQQAYNLVRELSERYDLRQQISRLRSNYKSFCCAAVLSSYKNKLIDNFGGPQLFRWMLANAETRNMVVCGPDALCLKREVIVRGTHSLCFFRCHPYKPEIVELLFVCRSYGKDIYEFIFREGSCFAMSIVDRIAVDGAGLLLTELEHAATQLRLERLWKSVSQTAPGIQPSDIQELLELSHVKPLTRYIAMNTDIERFLQITEERQWMQLLLKMKNDTQMFSHSYPIATPDEDVSCRLLYLKQDDVFLKITIGQSDERLNIELVARNDELGGTAGSLVATRICNYILHYLWSELLR